MDLKGLMAMRYPGVKSAMVYVHYMSKSDSDWRNPATVDYLLLDKTQIKPEIKEYLFVVSTHKQAKTKQRFVVWGKCSTDVLKAVRKFLNKGTCTPITTPTEHKQSEILDALWHSGDFKAWNSYRTKERASLASKKEPKMEEAGAIALLGSPEAALYSRTKEQFLKDKRDWYKLNVLSQPSAVASVPVRRIHPFDY